MSNDNVFALKNPGVANAVRDPLAEVLREGVRTLPAQVIAREQHCWVHKMCQRAEPTVQTPAGQGQE